MIEKIRISLWDVFTFFMTGVFAVIAILLFFKMNGSIPKIGSIFEILIKIPATYIVVVMPILLILLGLLIEPLANFFDRYFGKYVFFWIKTKNKQQKPDEVKVEEYIKEKCLGDLNMKIEKPFSLCKEFVETKQLSTTFMVFLARYGFYRNCSFIVMSTGIFAFMEANGCAAVTWLIVSYFFSGLLKKRADEFYSYQATAVYNAFLIETLNWPSKSTG